MYNKYDEEEKALREAKALGKQGRRVDRRIRQRSDYSVTVFEALFVKAETKALVTRAQLDKRMRKTFGEPLS